jgi:hypothetical protein
MAKPDDLEKDFDRLIAGSGGAVNSNFSNTPIVAATALLGKAIIRLDRTSTRLSYVNIGLGIAILLTALVQICLMLHAK